MTTTTTTTGTAAAAATADGTGSDHALHGPPQDPLIVIIGSTGTGKSKLAVHLSQLFNGEIVNADAMQMYKGLPIITNKHPVAEREGIPHHLLDMIGLEEKPWTVTRFVREGLKVIEEIRCRGKLPIVVGGTHYYTHALVFQDAILPDQREAGNGKSEGHQDDEDLPMRASDTEELIDPRTKWPILEAPTEEIFAKLQEIDPIMASRWHPKDRRKIQRSLEIWLKTGRKASDVYAEQERARNGVIQQRRSKNDGTMSGQKLGLRFPTTFLWLDAEDSPLKERLDQRVEVMLEQGLILEALTMRKIERDLRGQGVDLDDGKGIWVSIGYKELLPVLDRHLEDDADADVKLARECIDSIKAGTRQYAKRQKRYIRIRLARALEDADALKQLFLLDYTDLEHWDEKVAVPGCELVEKFLRGSQLPSAATLSKLADRTLTEMSQGNDTGSIRVARHCDTCNKTLMTEKEWLGHLSSRSHKKMMQIKNKHHTVKNSGEVDQVNCTRVNNEP